MKGGASVERRASSVERFRTLLGGLGEIVRRAVSTLDARRSTLLLGFLALSSPLDAQDPTGRWSSLTTPHFRVHFTPELEPQARRAAVNAEHAWSMLAKELVPPRGPVDLVLADNVDFTNGFATPFPSNRIVIYTQPPIGENSLRFYDDWNALVITHELTHVFHRDRSRGIWRLGQHVLGRNPLLFPNAYLPDWFTEGLAVYYESRLTGSGRIVGSEHRMIARAAAAAAAMPELDALSGVASGFPGAGRVYSYGSLFVDYLARTRGPEHVRDFIEHVSVTPVPFFLDRAAKRSFGVTFSQAYREWRDSVQRALPPREQVGSSAPVGVPGVGAWRELTTEGFYAAYPRWRDDSTLLYAASDAKQTTGLYAVGLDGKRRRVARRNALEPNVPLPNGDVLFAQLDYVSAYVLRSDLFLGHGASERRLTTGARLRQPDARADGAIVAVQAVPATSRLVRVRLAASGAEPAQITPITSTSPDTQWAEPRWSPDGNRIAAVRVTRGGVAAIVVLDTLGNVLREAARGREVLSSPAWSGDGARIYFTSDRTGSPQIYEADARASASRERRLSGVATGLFQPSPSPDGANVTALLFAADGYHVATAPRASLTPLPDSTIIPQSTLGPPVSDSGLVHRYSPWRMLRPTFWLPIVDQAADGGASYGGYTAAHDVVGKHSYAAQATMSPRSGQMRGYGTYRYAGLGVPLVDAGFTQNWDAFTITDTARRPVGTLNRRARIASLSLTAMRPRMRTFSTASIGTQLEWRDYSTDPGSLLPRLAPVFRTTPTYPALFASAGWSNTQRPLRSISPEDGVAFTGSGRLRWERRDTTVLTRRVIGAARAYKSLGLPGFAHHVLALRAVGGWADSRSTADFEVGGVSGSTAELLPGVVLGDPQRTFAVRGFAPGVQQGTRALAGSLEYRAPLLVAGRGIRLLPVFLDRTSIALFGDVGEAWCPTARVNPECLNTTGARRTLGSAGAELNLDAALQYDVPYRLRAGIAAPVLGREQSRKSASVYVTFGTAF